MKIRISFKVHHFWFTLRKQKSKLCGSPCTFLCMFRWYLTESVRWPSCELRNYFFWGTQACYTYTLQVRLNSKSRVVRTQSPSESKQDRRLFPESLKVLHLSWTRKPFNKAAPCHIPDDPGKPCHNSSDGP